MSSKSYENSNERQIDRYMNLLKKSMEMDQKKKEKDKNKNKNNNNDNPNQNKNNGKNKRKGEGSNGSNGGKCRKHPNANHTWKEFFMNPNNPNNKLNDLRYNPELRKRNKDDNNQNQSQNNGGSYYHHHNHGYHPQQYGARSQGQDSYYKGP